MFKYLMVMLLITKFAGCEENNTAMNQPFHIYYSKGSAWTGWHYEAELNSQGKLIVNESRNLPSPSERKMEYNIDPKEVDSLLYMLQSVSSIKLESYETDAIKAHDFPVVTLKYTLNNQSDSTTMCQPEKNKIPVQFELLLEMVNRIILKYDIKK